MNLGFSCNRNEKYAFFPEKAIELNLKYISYQYLNVAIYLLSKFGVLNLHIFLLFRIQT